MKDIEQFSNEELLKELRARCSPMIFMGHRIEDGGVAVHWHDWGGADGLCFGLCHSLSFYIQQKMVGEQVGRGFSNDE